MDKGRGHNFDQCEITILLITRLTYYLETCLMHIPVFVLGLKRSARFQQNL